MEDKSLLLGLTGDLPLFRIVDFYWITKEWISARQTLQKELKFPEHPYSTIGQKLKSTAL